VHVRSWLLGQQLAQGVYRKDVEHRRWVTCQLLMFVRPQRSRSVQPCIRWSNQPSHADGNSHGPVTLHHSHIGRTAKHHTIMATLACNCTASDCPWNRERELGLRLIYEDSIEPQLHGVSTSTGRTFEPNRACTDPLRNLEQIRYAIENRVRIGPQP